VTERPSALRALFAPLRRLYAWVLSWADTPWGPFALFMLSFVESSFFPIPPDPLLIALCLGRRRASLLFALNCTVASVLGGLLGYWIGASAFDLLAMPILRFYGKVAGYEALAAEFNANGSLAVIVAAITPVPYKLVTLTAGAVGMDLAVFTGASIFGRGLRFFAVAGLLWWIGEPVARFIERWFEALAIAFTVLLVGGALAFRYLL
jgi:membrane protein YqaA with SNARE-associated domain